MLQEMRNFFTEVVMFTVSIVCGKSVCVAVKLCESHLLERWMTRVVTAVYMIVDGSFVL